MRVECDLVLPISHQPSNHFLSLSHGSESLWPRVLYFSILYSKKKKILGFTCRGWNKTSRPYNEVAKKETSSCGPEELPNQNSNWLLHRGSHAIFSLVGPYILLFEILSNIRLSQVDIKQIFIELFEYWVISIWTKEISSALPIVARNFQLLSEDFNQIVGQSKDKAYVKIIGMNQGNIIATSLQGTSYTESYKGMYRTHYSSCGPSWVLN